MSAFDAEHFQWDRNRPTEPAPPAAITDDKFDLAVGGAHDLLNMAEGFRVKIENGQADEIADSRWLRKALFMEEIFGTAF
ncbi:MAG: hypothetical protein WAR76_18225 [Xanthobacteraceae bacterium]